jgi:peptidoglycan/xylan/chitin deacetylase (PgdA/CDA1 family)
MPQIRSAARTLTGRVMASSGLLRRGLRGAGVIVAFHRVNDATADDPLTHGTRSYEAFCRFFRTHFDVVPLSDLIGRLEAGRSIEGLLTITHDDGYVDNFEHAAPLLEKVGVPATFFVSSGFIGTETVAPWDVDIAEHLGWMTWDQVREMRVRGFEIGAHTVNHVDLGRVSAEDARAELAESRRHLERELGLSIDLFAYPFGAADNICPRNLEIVREVGYRCCVSCYGGVARNGDDVYALQRVPMSSWYENPDQLALALGLDRA